MKVGSSPAAQADLIAIALVIAQDNPARAITFVIFYRSMNTALRIERILHGARDGDGQDFEE